jgi:hypothetical protein
MLFQGQYWFHGTHADKVKRLTAEFNNNKQKLFSYNHEVYQLSPIVGFLYNRKSPLNKDNNSDTSIFPGEISSHRDIFLFNYQLIMLLDKEYEHNFDSRIDKAFRYFGTDKAKDDEELYESYVRGGIDILFEKLIEPSTSSDDYIKNLYDFVNDFETRYGQSSAEIRKLCEIEGN